MSDSSDRNDNSIYETQSELRSKIVGLGKGSLRKSYFPQLQDQIKKLRLAKERAEENEKKFSLIFNSTSDALILVNLDDGGFYLFNQTACRMFHYTYEEMERLKVWELFAHNNKSLILNNLVSNSVSYKATLSHVEMRTSDNCSIYCDITTSFVDIAGSSYLLAAFRDITELAKSAKENEEVKARLIQAQKMEAIGTLAGGIAHDFNNILSGIFGYSRLAETSIKDQNSEKALSYIKNILQSGQKAAELINQILTFSRASSPQKHPMTLSIDVKETLKLLRSIIPTTIDINVTIKSNAKILGNPTKIHQVLMNLCTNAYHAMRESGGILSITLTEIDCTQKDCIPELNIKSGKYLELEVKDTGTGIDKEIIGKIFDPYFTTKKEGQGTGLGLSIVHVVVQEHDGYIKVESEPEKGSVFRVYFPVVERKRDVKNSETNQCSSQFGTETIILVDDEQMILDVTKEILESRGYEVLPFISGIAALKAFKQEPDKFNLIITDMTMPGMEGDQFAIEALKIRPDIPIILCTGYSDKISEEKALQIGIKKYVEKPLITKNLDILIREVLDL
ncbi:MAG: response regulator [Desulfamplus sp.]|nr:response regulator [Desulfamplus sp.]